jgi:transketolase
MRTEFCKVLIELAEADPRIFMFTGDCDPGIFPWREVKKKFPERIINLGTCEQSLVSVVAGMASEGFIPVVYSITPFILERPFEQLKILVDQQNLPVILVGYDDYPNLGYTHMCLNPKIMMGLFKNFTGYYPKRAKELRNILTTAVHDESPSFIFLKKEPK